jgi:hypothetical protein
LLKKQKEHQKRTETLSKSSSDLTAVLAVRPTPEPKLKYVKVQTSGLTDPTTSVKIPNSYMHKINAVLADEIGDNQT